jgi:hypothetical protein
MTGNKPLEVKFAEPRPTRVLLEEDLFALDTISDLLTFYVETQPDDPIHFNRTTKNAFLNIAKTIRERVNERSIDFNGEKYIIMAKGRRRLTLGFKREPDLYIGSEWGLNFLEACQSFFVANPFYSRYNYRKNSYCGRHLFTPPFKNAFKTGIKSTQNGYATWFKINNQTFTLAEVPHKGDATLSCKLLNNVFENLLTIKNSKP